MKNFTHVDARSVHGAVGMLDADACILAGGTDLLGRMKLGITTPEKLVNIKTIPDMNIISFDEEHGLSLGALATLDSIYENRTVQKRYPLLAKAISLAASPQLRNAATIGGNMAQEPRCWYFRGSFDCWLKGGERCLAQNGENEQHAIFGEGPCHSVHPSDPAVALCALKAEVLISGPGGERSLPVEDLFQSPHEGARRLTVLQTSEMITEVRIPVPVFTSRGNYIKAMERKAWSFALASVAALVNLDGDG